MAHSSLSRRSIPGFQSSVDPERAVADIAFTAPMESVLSQLRQRQDFDVNMFQGFFIPEDGLNAQHVIKGTSKSEAPNSEDRIPSSREMNWMKIFLKFFSKIF